MGKRNLRNITVGIGSACSSLAIMAVPALAQSMTPTAAPGGLEEIVVTAQKRAESLQNTPLAVSAISAEAIEQRGITDISTLTAIALRRLSPDGGR